MERRRHPRVPVAATAVVFVRGKFCGPYLVENISGGGMLLCGTPTFDPGEPVSVLAKIPGSWVLQLHGVVVRSESQPALDHRVAIEFRGLTSATEARLETLAREAIRQVFESEPATVLVVDDSNVVCQALRREIGALGRAVLCVANPHDALAALSSPTSKLEVALVDLDLQIGSTDGLELIEYMATDHPRIRRVLLAGEQRSSRVDLALVTGRAHAVVQKPWDPAVLARALFGRRD